MWTLSYQDIHFLQKYIVISASHFLLPLSPLPPSLPLSLLHLHPHLSSPLPPKLITYTKPFQTFHLQLIFFLVGIIITCIDKQYLSILAIVSQYMRRLNIYLTFLMNLIFCVLWNCFLITINGNHVEPATEDIIEYPS